MRRSDPVTGEPVVGRVSIVSNVAFDADSAALRGEDGSGHVLDFEFLAAESAEKRAVFRHVFHANDVAGSYQLQLVWRDRRGRVGDSDALRAMELRDEPDSATLGEVDSGLDEYAEPRTLYVTRPWGTHTKSGYREPFDTLSGRVIQRAKRPEDCIAQLLLYGTVEASGEPRSSSMLGIAEVSGIAAAGCKTDSSSFAERFATHTARNLYVVPLTLSGHRGKPQQIVHGEWVATLRDGVVGGSETDPHRLLTHLRVPQNPAQPGSNVAIPAASTDQPYLGSWEERHSSASSPPLGSEDINVVFDPHHGETIVLSSDGALGATKITAWDGARWTDHGEASVHRV